MTEAMFNSRREPGIPELRINHKQWLDDVRDWISTFGPLSDYSGMGLSEAESVQGEYWTMWEQSDIPGSDQSGQVMTDAGHTNFMWNARDQLQPLFQDVWRPQGDEYLVSSFEGFMYCVRGNNEPKTFLNLNHPQSVNYPICVRGFVSLSESNNNEHGGFILVDKSHEWFAEREGQQSTDRLGSIPINQLWNTEKSRFIRPVIPRGGVLLIDSRMIYTTYSPTSIEHPFVTLNVTMMLSSGMEESDIDKRIQWFYTRKQTGPWCYGTNAKLSSGIDTVPFASSDRDNRGVLIKNGQSVAKTVYGDIHGRLVAGMTINQIDARYIEITKRPTITNGIQRKTRSKAVSSSASKTASKTASKKTPSSRSSSRTTTAPRTGRTRKTQPTQ